MICHSKSIDSNKQNRNRKIMEMKATLAKMKKNLCSKYLLPTLQIANKNFTSSTLKELGFVNAYLEVNAATENGRLHLNKENCIYLIFSFDKAREATFRTISQALKLEVPNFSGSYKIAHYVYVLAFDVLPKWSFILDLFKDGKYSDFGKSYANEFIINSSKNRRLVLDQYKVITRDPSYIQLKSDELGINPSVLCDMDLDEYPTKEDYVFYYQQTEVEPAKNPHILNIEIKGPGLSSLPKEY
jgi:hypothetical protein